jgi:hypothetical protein
VARRSESPKDWSPRGGKYQKLAEEAVQETAKIEDYLYRGELELGETWAFTFSKNRDSGLLEESNYETIKKALEERFQNDVEEVRSSHWAVGWVEQLAVRMLSKAGRVTPAGIAALEWKGKLENYPVADEEDFSRREYEDTIENIKNEGSVDEETAGKVYSWLSDNNQGAIEPSDGGGGYPSTGEIDEALIDLGLKKPEEEEEPEELPEPPFHDPSQAWIWPETRPDAP